MFCQAEGIHHRMGTIKWTKWLGPLPLASHYYQTPPNGTEHLDGVAKEAKMEALYGPNDTNSPLPRPV